MVITGGKKIELSRYIVYISFLIVLAVFSIILHDKGFSSYNNMMNILRQTAMISVAAVGMTFVISAGLIDLSTGSVVALAALVTAVVLRTQGLLVAVLAGVGVGLACGFLNGVITSRVRIPAFLVTLGTSTIYAGLARNITNLEAVPITNARFNNIFGAGDVGPISSLFIWTLIMVAIGQVVYRKTAFGRSVLAVGGNEAAARYSGIVVFAFRAQIFVTRAYVVPVAGIAAGEPRVLGIYGPDGRSVGWPAW